MRLTSFYEKGIECLGVVTENGILDVRQAAGQASGVPLTMAQAIEMGAEGLRRLEALPLETAHLRQASELEWAPVIQPGKMLCVGFNYHKHVSESSAELPKFPILFSKFSNALAAHNQPVSLPEAVSGQYDYEAELVIVIGREGRFIPKEKAMDYVFGFTVGNDISARDLQFRSGQWLIGKSLDGFGPIGPYLTTTDSLDWANLEVTCRVNGEQRQKGNTREMIFDCCEIIRYASQFMTLCPGDIIFTGTPEGVVMGMPKERQLWLKPGDVVEAEIQGIGTLRTPFIK
ncbi:fumarylacetoacetate hydrolase family protein [Oscillospiraceae bacterium MB08-C2-2]|nr:fumarylacetoacetate hydrolase family protein [Oscillospiraceae bacterium MB08-C2-2]